MERRHYSTKHLLLSTLAFFATTTFAQTNTATNKDATTTAAAAATTGNTATKTATGTDTGATLPALTSAATTTTSKTTTTGASTTLPGLSSATNPTDLPKISTSTIPTYPAASVPPTQNAPFMQKSNLPEGTVFIAVGAILGAFGAAILIWRAVVACLLHRSVKRANLAQHMANDKAAMPGAPSHPFYTYKDQESQGSLGAANATPGRGVRRTQRGPIPSATPSQTNLFFSPTAANTGNNAGNRSSTFLPAGFYAAGQGAPQQEHGQSISLTNLRPDSRGVGRPSGHTPPESPGLTPRANSVRHNPQMSTSSVNLNQVPPGRAPSTYLEDLLDENPQQFPPPGGFHSWNNQSRDRF